ncbi:MAG TPA: sugar phosphate nucleotidyltransferase [Edaphocola sp.]|nr:sugar phosphate nucleotidyltransferase [Edaphocola sp.]
MINVILSGGVGSRLWPLSRKSCLKQYISLFGGKTLFQLCALRNKAFCGQLMVVGNRDNRHLSRQNLEGLGWTDYLEITEAVPRNTAPEDILLITPSDQVISDTSAYEQAVKEAEQLARSGSLVTFGIQPDRPETGYGYIEHRDNEVLSFKEKPDMETAHQMLQHGGFLWNSGMFCFKAGVFLEELQTHAPAVFASALKAWEQKKNYELPEKPSFEIPSISVDYAVMEHSEKIKVVKAENLGWSDLGSFDALWAYQKQQDHSSALRDNFVLGTKKPVFFLGRQQMIFVETDDAILIMPEDQCQGVKSLYERLEKELPELTR